ncbi:fumarate/nitrate reduction transcriptional regulator Fnr [Microbulbifer sp. 2205BS26-8]|uniref:fumarate/nitrate reduction transcriptional regulator Fnr n=1 Tax=Microbulbifer sp. 2205BS26-8 TaxID=3064386 RepID=UPI00273E3C87|nr:fumarate/nitrate reduction transcriptional regulator Fnr [Microbulbifer sp. 2205BS26-8]MDP5208619.1 fumarate/nitrate reduction transcriptional regulator Fnr [Microbulbifer sp. 2205BS26-8]
MVVSPEAVSCSNCSVRRLCLPAGPSRADIDLLEDVTRRKRIVRSGEMLYSAGDSFQNLFAIHSGSFKCVVTAADGDIQVTHFALPGELLGLDAYSRRRHNSYSEVLEDSSVCLLPFVQLERLAQQVPALQQQIYSLFSGELRQENELLMLLGKRSSDTRLVAFLINISSRCALRKYSPNQFVLSMPRIDIANYLGLTTETISRLFSRLRREQLIRVDGRSVQILDIVGLSEIAGTQCSYENSP